MTSTATSQQRQPTPKNQQQTCYNSASERWLHCNKCLAMASGESTAFFFVSCGHILCKQCCIKGSAMASKQTCVMCMKTGVSYADINRNINPKLKNLFRPAREVANECMIELQRVLDFQSRHRRNLTKALSDQRSKAVQFAHSARTEVQKEKEKSRQVVKSNEQLKIECGFLRKQLAAQKTENEQLRTQLNFLGTGAPDSGVGTVDTSMESMSFIDAITSTPIQVPTKPARHSLADAFQSGNGSMPSPIMGHTAALLTTPDMLGLKKRNNHNKIRSSSTPRQGFGDFMGNFEV